MPDCTLVVCTTGCRVLVLSSNSLSAGYLECAGICSISPTTAWWGWCHHGSESLMLQFWAPTASRTVLSAVIPSSGSPGAPLALAQCPHPHGPPLLRNRCPLRPRRPQVLPTHPLRLIIPRALRPPHQRQQPFRLRPLSQQAPRHHLPALRRCQRRPQFHRQPRHCHFQGP